MRQQRAMPGLCCPYSVRPYPAAPILLMVVSSCLHRGGGRRAFRVSSGDGDVSELIEKNLAPRRLGGGGEPWAAAQQLTTTRREALSLYRRIFRYSNLFVWRNEQGVPWRDLLRVSARREFEAARHETDPEIIARLLVGSSDAVQAAIDKFLAKRSAVMEEEARPAGPGGSGTAAR